MSPVQRFPLGEWMPDRDPIGLGPNLVDASDVFPTADGYQAFPNLVASLSAGSLNAYCVGAYSGRRRNDGTAYTSAATASKLYVTDTSGALTDYTGTWSLGATSTTSFLEYGGTLLAASIEHIIQAHTLSGTSNFADVSSHAPKARHLALIGEQVVAGNIVGQGDNAASVGTSRDGLQWSAIGNAASWPEVGTDAAAAVLSGWQPLRGNGGDVQGITGGREYGIVLQERQVWRMDFAGGTDFFRFTRLDDTTGALVPGSVIQIGYMTFFYSQKGWMVCDGTQVRPIGYERVDDFFRADFDAGYAHRVSAVTDPSRHLVVWAYPGENHSSGTPNRLLVYNYALDRWSIVKTVSVERLVRGSQVGANVDTPISSDIDGSPFDVDDVSFAGVTPELAAFVPTSHALYAFTGGGLSGRVQTGDFDLGGTSFVRGIRPIQQGSGSTIARVGSRKLPTSSVSWTGFSVPSSADGNCGFRARSRYHRVELYQLTDPGTITGFDAEFEPMGMR